MIAPIAIIIDSTIIIKDEILLHVYKILIIEDYKTKNILNYGGDITNYRESGSSY